MLRSCLGTLVLWVLANSAGQESGFVQLFNGKDLTGWKSYNGKAETWGAEDGLLFTQKGGGGWLMTEKEYADFELRFKYKMPKMGNSGVAMRSPLQGDPAYTGMEIQLLDDANWQGLKPTQYCGSIYDVVPASKDVTKPPGEWNAMRIVAHGRHVTIELNGEKTIDANLDEYKDRLKEDKEKKLAAHPGLARTKGHIGFQSYNFRVEFRNIRIKELEK